VERAVRGRSHGPGGVAWLRLARVFGKIDRLSAAHLAGWSLSVAQFDVLVQVGATPGLTQQDVADALLVTKGNISQLIDRMARDGLLLRVKEGRLKRLSLTERGRALYAVVTPAQEGFIAARFAALSPADQRELLRLLRLLDHALH